MMMTILPVDVVFCRKRARHNTSEKKRADRIRQEIEEMEHMLQVGELNELVQCVKTYVVAFALAEVRKATKEGQTLYFSQHCAVYQGIGG